MLDTLHEAISLTILLVWNKTVNISIDVKWHYFIFKIYISYANKNG